MVRGVFRRVVHDHYFEVVPKGTRMVDVFDYSAPFGPLGVLVERFYLAYMARFLERRGQALRALAESDGDGA